MKNIPYDNSQVRRQDRLLDKERAFQLLSTCEWGVLSMTDIDGKPYAIPVNYVYDGEQSLYIHCAPQGRKLHALKENPHVSFCIVGEVNLLPGQFTTEYESIILTGIAHLSLPEEERMQALRLLIGKLSPDHQQLGEAYSAKSFHRVEIIRIDVGGMSGKAKKVAASKNEYVQKSGETTVSME